MKEKNRVVPKKNYLYLLIMLVLVVFVTFTIVYISKKYNMTVQTCFEKEDFGLGNPWNCIRRAENDTCCY